MVLNFWLCYSQQNCAQSIQQRDIMAEWRRHGTVMQWKKANICQPLLLQSLISSPFSVLSHTAALFFTVGSRVCVTVQPLMCVCVNF